MSTSSAGGAAAPSCCPPLTLGEVCSTLHVQTSFCSPTLLWKHVVGTVWSPILPPLQCPSHSFYQHPILRSRSARGTYPRRLDGHALVIAATALSKDCCLHVRVTSCWPRIWRQPCLQSNGFQKRFVAMRPSFCMPEVISNSMLVQFFVHCLESSELLPSLCGPPTTTHHHEQ